MYFIQVFALTLWAKNVLVVPYKLIHIAQHRFAARLCILPRMAIIHNKADFFG